MKLKKEIECILRAILYPQTQICFMCKNEIEAEKCMSDFKRIINNHEILKMEVDTNKSDIELLFKNGSYINVLSKKYNNESIRGKSANNLWVFDDDFFRFKNR